MPLPLNKFLEFDIEVANPQAIPNVNKLDPP